ncbi:MAG: FkbM family methyltransferase [Gammaproteobacteria bacterium]|nr:FkbM family methyltransferase [Gammaproteobacteria bacterium]
MINHVTRQLFTRLGLYPGKPVQPERLRSLVDAMCVTPTGQDLIRIGPEGDGGYLLPDDLDGIGTCFSPGVADCSDFELELANRGMRVYLADRSVDGPAVADDRFSFVKKFLASTTDEDAGLVTLDDWCRDALGDAYGDTTEMLLQMDIEGAEYEVLHNIPDALLLRFRIVVIELHRLHQLVDRFAFRFMEAALRKLLRTHAVVHLHPNNHRHALRYAGLEIPSHMEVTLLRRDRLTPGSADRVFPHPLDRECNPRKPALVLPACWYRESRAHQ